MSGSIDFDEFMRMVQDKNVKMAEGDIDIIFPNKQEELKFAQAYAVLRKKQSFSF